MFSISPLSLLCYFKMLCIIVCSGLFSHRVCEHPTQSFPVYKLSFTTSKCIFLQFGYCERGGQVLGRQAHGPLRIATYVCS